jgi:heterodisulfide reductase subunit C
MKSEEINNQKGKVSNENINKEISKGSDNRKRLKESEEDFNLIKKIEQIKLQSENLKEEANEIIENCIKCGICKGLCPVFKVILEERFSPRGHSILLQEKIINESLYKCTLCKACEIKCPQGLKICDAIIKAREAFILTHKELSAKKGIIENIINTGNPFTKRND